MDIVDELRRKAANWRAVGWELTDRMRPHEAEEMADLIASLRSERDLNRMALEETQNALMKERAERDKLREALERLGSNDGDVR